jgi:O-antigen/teichoic acid export membrane protein
MINLSRIRRRLEVQGFLGLTDDELKAIGPWMRFTPVLNLTFTVMATASSSIPLLVGLAILMAAGAIMPVHPFDAFYNGLVRRITRTQPLPKSGVRRRIVFAVGTVWLLLTTGTFLLGMSVLGYVLGGLMAVFIAPLATIHVCVLSEGMARIFGPPV